MVFGSGDIFEGQFADNQMEGSGVLYGSPGILAPDLIAGAALLSLLNLTSSNLVDRKRTTRSMALKL